jgi:hypothetical protein
VEKWEKWAGYEPGVKKFVAERVYGRGGNSEDVEDIVSNVMLKFIETAKEINLSYVYGVTKGEIKKHFCGSYSSYDDGRKIPCVGIFDTDVSDINPDILVPFVNSLTYEETIVWLVLVRKLKQREAAKAISYSRKGTNRKIKTITDNEIWYLLRKLKQKLANFLNVPVERVYNAKIPNAWGELSSSERLLIGC